MFSCEYCEISKNTCFEKHLRTAASELTLGSDSLGLFFLDNRFKNHPDLAISQKYKLRWNQSFKRDRCICPL